MLNGIKCVPCNGTGMTTVFDAQAIMRAMAHLERDNLIQAVKALRDYTSGEVSLKAAVDYAREVMKPEVEAIRKLQAVEDGESHNEWAARRRQIDAYGGGDRDPHGDLPSLLYKKADECDCEYTPCGVLGHNDSLKADECDCIENTCNECLDEYNPATNKAVFQ